MLTKQYVFDAEQARAMSEAAGKGIRGQIETFKVIGSSE